MLENLPKLECFWEFPKNFPYYMLGLFPIMLDYANSNYSCELCRVRDLLSDASYSRTLKHRNH